MPLQHVEDRDLQKVSVSTYEDVCQESPSEWKPLMEGVVRYARQHQEIVEKFGRFPHRNILLGRESTVAETAWLEEGGERFGQ
jgi:uncharacterized protein (DUF924 family)